MLNIYGSKHSKHNSFINVHLSTTNVDGLYSRIENIEKTVNLYEKRDSSQEKKTPHFQTPTTDTTPIIRQSNKYPDISPSNITDKVKLLVLSCLSNQ